MTYESRILTVLIDRPWRTVYEYLAEPRNMAHWAGGLGSDPRPAPDGRWTFDTPGGPVAVRFAEPNDLGVADHWVELGTSTVYVPLRVIANADGAEVQFTLHRQPGMSDVDLERDAARVRADLDRLKAELE